MPSDPRIQRTHAHVFHVLGQMLEDRTGTQITLNSLAAESLVSKRTLNVYWATIEDVLAAAMMAGGVMQMFNDSQSPEERLLAFLTGVRTTLQDPLSFTATLALAAAAKSTQEPMPDAKIYVIIRAWKQYYRAWVGPINEEEYSRLVGPIAFQELFTPNSASDAMLEEQVALGMRMMFAYAA